jgi:hypothetical protein
MAAFPIEMLLNALSQNGYAKNDSSTLQDIIACSSRDAQYSREAAEHVGILNRFRVLGSLTVRELKLLQNPSPVAVKDVTTTLDSVKKTASVTSDATI